MVSHKLSISTAEDLTYGIPEYRSRVVSFSPVKYLFEPEEPTCRICLDPCPQITYCLCKGSSMIHEQCLKMYLNKGHENRKYRPKCEICNQYFRVVFSSVSHFSCANAYNNIKNSSILFVMFAVYCLLTFIYIGYVSYLYSSNLLDQQIQLILLIVGVCLSLIVIGLIIKWIITNLFVKTISLSKVLPFQRQRATSLNLNGDNRIINQTLENF